MCEYKEINEELLGNWHGINMPEAFNEDGELRPGVQVIEADSGKVVAEGKDKDRFPSNNLGPNDEGFLDDSFSGDYCEMRDVLMLNTRWAIVDAVCKLSARRCIQLREHLLQLAAYHEQWRETAIEIALIVTRILANDNETDKQHLPNTEFNIGKYTEAEEDEDDKQVEVGDLEAKREEMNKLASQFDAEDNYVACVGCSA
jgi:hypothetical protein